jgi:hypothetical protein
MTVQNVSERNNPIVLICRIRWNLRAKVALVKCVTQILVHPERVSGAVFGQSCPDQRRNWLFEDVTG